MKNRFLVLVDYSPYSGELLRFAHAWSKEADADLLIIHRVMVHVPVLAHGEMRKEIIDLQLKNSLEDLKVFSEEILEGETHARHYVSEENLLTILPRFLNEPFHNLIFLGLKGTGIFKKIFMGSTAVDVIDNIDNTVILLPKNPKPYSCAVLSVAVQLKYPLNTQAFDQFLRFTNKKVQRIHFFSVQNESLEEMQNTEEYLKRLSEQYSDRADISYALYTNENPSKALNTLIAQNEQQFLIVQRGSRLFSDQILRPYLINDLVYAGDTPMIVLP